MTEPGFVVRPHGDGGVELMFVPQAMTALKSVFGMLIVTDVGSQATPFRRRAFPSAYRFVNQADAFRDRHESGMRAEVLRSVGRILAGWPDDGAFLLDPWAVDDWVVTLVQARWLYVDRHETGLFQPTERFELSMASWLGALQIDLVRAALPRLAAFSHPATPSAYPSA